jgi:methylated-DNA-protein-cysteine methyltransferase-like protein
MKNNRLETKSFYSKVYDAVRQIPKGRVTTYGEIAKYIGQPGVAKMVGWAMNSSHSVHPPVPAHRVVNRNGILSGKMHFHPPELMARLLEHEGVEVIDDKVKNFSEICWLPLQEIKY